MKLWHFELVYCELLIGRFLSCATARCHRRACTIIKTDIHAFMLWMLSFSRCSSTNAFYLGPAKFVLFVGLLICLDAAREEYSEDPSEVAIPLVLNVLWCKRNGQVIFGIQLTYASCWSLSTLFVKVDCLLNSC